MSHRVASHIFLNIGSGNVPSPVRHPTNNKTSTEIHQVISTGPLKTNYSDILIIIQTVSVIRIHFKTSWANCERVWGWGRHFSVSIIYVRRLSIILQSVIVTARSFFSAMSTMVTHGSGRQDKGSISWVRCYFVLPQSSRYCSHNTHRESLQ